jgi:rhomboid family protein
VLPLRDATPPRRTPVITYAIVALCSAAFVLELWVLVQGGPDALDAFITTWGIVPADVASAIRSGDLLSPAVLGLVTGMFLHAGWPHLLGNMLFLWIFATRVEDRMGRVLFPLFYLAGGIAAGLTYVLVDPSSTVPAIGASGAISAVMGAYVVLYPGARIQSLVFLGFFYQLIAVPSIIVLGFWFALQLIDGFASLGATTDVGGGVAWFAHIGGFVAGVLLALPFRLADRTRARPSRRGPSDRAADVAPPSAPDPTLLPPPAPGRG